MTGDEQRHDGEVVPGTGDKLTKRLFCGYYRKFRCEYVHLHYRSNAGSCSGDVIYGDGLRPYASAVRVPSTPTPRAR